MRIESIESEEDEGFYKKMPGFSYVGGKWAVVVTDWDNRKFFGI